MKQYEVFILFATVIAVAIFSVWMGGAMALSICVKNGEFKHGLLTETVKCEATK